MKTTRSAFTLLEVLLASVVFIVSIAGVFSTLTYVRAPVVSKENALSAAVFGKQVLESLRSQVDNTSYYNSCATNPCQSFDLTLGVHNVPMPAGGLTWPSSLTNCNTTLNYTVSCSDSTADFSNCASAGANPNMGRRVDLNISWFNPAKGSCA